MKRYFGKCALFSLAALAAAAFLSCSGLQGDAANPALALVGISDGFGNPLMTGFFTDIPEVKDYGYDRAFGIYSIFENIAQSGGSFVFSYVLIMGVAKGLSMVAVVLAALSLIFLFAGIFEKKTKKTDDDMANDAA